MDMYVYVMGRALKAIRKQRKIRQDELADICGYSQSTISRIEKWHDDLSLTYVRRLCDVFNVDFIQLHELCVTCCKNIKPLNLPDVDLVIRQFAEQKIVDDLVKAHVQILMNTEG